MRQDLLDRYAELARRERLLPVRVTSVYRHLVTEELEALNHTDGPLYRVAYPTAERLDLRVRGEVADFVDDRSNMPAEAEGVVIRKYPDRLLFLITDQCAGHCLYCFRQDVLSDQKAAEALIFEHRLERLLAYLQRAPEVGEVILSGGDPLNVTFEHLKTTFARITSETQVRALRVHTRNVIFAPTSLSDRTCGLLASHDVRLVIHVVHPYELHPEAIRVLKRAVSTGVRCFAQFPILRGVNDHATVLTELLRRLEDLRVRPLTMFIPDPVNYSAVYRLSLQRLLAIIREIHCSTPAWINAVRVVLDTPVGKVRPEDIVEWNRRDGIVVFRRGDHLIRYPDFPEDLDIPGDIATMLWRADAKHRTQPVP